MFAGQVNWVIPADSADQRGLSDDFADGNESATAFAQVYEAILGLSDEQCSESGASNELFDIASESDLSETRNYSGQHGTISAGSGTGAWHFTSDQGSKPKIAIGSLEALNYGSSMARFISKGGEEQIEPVRTNGVGIEAAAVNSRGGQSRNSGQQPGCNGSVTAPLSSGGVLNRSELSDWMDAHALSRSGHHCAMYCRLGMEAAGINTGDRPQSGDAGDYGPFLLRHGAQTVPPDSYVPQVGDVVVFDKTRQHPNGHIEMYDGHQWVSDFMQQSFSPYRDVMSTPPFTIYRLS